MELVDFLVAFFADFLDVDFFVTFLVTFFDEAFFLVAFF